MRSLTGRIRSRARGAAEIDVETVSSRGIGELMIVSHAFKLRLRKESADFLQSLAFVDYNEVRTIAASRYLNPAVAGAQSSLKEQTHLGVQTFAGLGDWS